MLNGLQDVIEPPQNTVAVFTMEVLVLTLDAMACTNCFDCTILAVDRLTLGHHDEENEGGTVACCT